MYTTEDQRTLYELSKKLLATENSHADNQQYLDLQKTIVYHEWRYYVLNDPVVSDYEYDQLFKKLEHLESVHPEWISADSPTQRVSADLTSAFPSVQHLTPMLSLDNSYNAEDLFDFDRQVKKLTGLSNDSEVEYCVEPKFDGGSIAIVYEADKLLRGATRGNGEVGEEITNNVRAMRSVPLKAPFSKYNISRAELRGEVLIRKDNFKKINQEREMEGLTLLANPRNSASGGLRVKDPNEVVKRGLEAFLYELKLAEDANGNNVLAKIGYHADSIDLLGSIGFKVPAKEKKVCKNIQEVIDYCIAWEAKREDYPYEIDGMVVKVNSLDLQEKSGYTSHHPRWAIAFKFKAKQATTKLLNVEYQVGKIGSITPVAKLEPVALAGVTVSSVSLHNEDFIVSKDIRISDTVLVERAGDVIPYIVKPMEELRDGNEKEINFPRFCPLNFEEQIPLIRVEDESAWRCPKCTCGAQDLQRMIFHISKDAMDIDGFGKSYVERFYKLGWLRNMADIYQLDYDKIAELEGFGQKSATNLRASIEKAKQNPIYRLLHSLSIHHLGKKASRLLAERINHVLELEEWKEEDFLKIKDIGPVVATNVIDYFSDSDNIEMLRKMEALGVNLSQTEKDKPRKIPTDGPFSGETILFTGALQTMGRKEAQALAEEAGAKNISAVSSNLNVLVVGEKAGSKLKKAQALGTIEIISEDEFLKRIGKQ